MEWKECYEYWIENVSSSIKKEIEKFSLSEKQKLFSEELIFGTAGIRGIIGYAPSLLNEFVIAKYTLAFAKTLLQKYGESAKEYGIVITHDNRRNNILFSETAAKVMSAQGIKVFLFANNELQPTPLLSYTIAKGNYVGGINITASHNPPEYSGFKLYDHTGTQMLDETTNKIIKFSKDNINIFKIKKTSTNISYLNKGIINQYVDSILKLVLFDLKDMDKSNLKVIFTSQHGTATPIAEKILKKLNVDYHLVKEQSYPDPEFTNTKSPNPQNPDSFILAREYGDKYDADVLFSTDPDADRFGIEIKHNGKWIHINGNELPLIQLEYKLRKLNELGYIKNGDFIVRSIVTSHAADEIANKYNVIIYESLTGFKWIINEAFKHEMQGDECLFAWEESYGSTVRTFTRDKDSFQALTQVIELMCEYKKENKTLVDVLDNIYSEIGYFKSEQIQLKLSGNDSMNKLNKVLNIFRNMEIGDIIINEIVITKKWDFKEGYKDFPKENIIILWLNNKSKISIRPSGTEPILRIYIDVQESSKSKCLSTLKTLKNYFENNIIKNEIK